MTTWKNITLHLPGLDLNTVSDQLSELNIDSITIIDKRKETQSNWFDDPNNPTNLSGDNFDLVLLVSSHTDVNQILEQIRIKLKMEQFPKYKEEIFEDKDWVEFTQSKFNEIVVTDSLRIVPPWESDSPFQGQSIIIQPGSGFGTGTHPTTQLCLKWLQNNIRTNHKVLDYGCGSGILSIGSKLFGAQFVEGVEIEHLAIQNAQINNTLNNMSIPFHHVDSFMSNKKYDIVVANILSSVLIQLSSVFEKYTDKTLILSGILENQVDDVKNAYKNWISLSVIEKSDGWVLLNGTLK